MALITFSSPMHKDKTVYAVAGSHTQTILALAKEHHIPIDFGCQEGNCGTCLVKVSSVDGKRRPMGGPLNVREVAALTELAVDLGSRGECNFLLSNGDWLFAHCSTQLTYIVRRAPFAEAHLTDQDVTVDFSEVTTPNDRVAVIATQPLTDDEVWTPLPPGSLWWFEEGEVRASAPTVAGPAEKCRYHCSSR